MSVLDVACGTGVLIPDYLERGAAQVTAIDIAPEMVRIAREKFPQENVTVLAVMRRRRTSLPCSTAS